MNSVYSRQQLRYLDAMGIPAWTNRRSHQSDINIATGETVSSANAGGICHGVDDFATWFSGVHLAQSQRSELLEGNPNSTLLIVEDAVLGIPGQRPFAGPASRLFDAMLKAIDLTRRDTLLATLTPLSGEMASSGSPLRDAMGSALRAVLFYSVPSGQHGLFEFEPLRERAHILQNDVPCIVSYHPKYLMDNHELKRAAWNDLKHVKQLLG